MRRPAALALLAAALVPGAAARAADPREDDATAALCERFSDFDHDGDGTVEIESLRPIEAARGGGGRPLLVLVEARLLEPLAAGEGEGAPTDLRPSLLRFARDLAADGFDPRLIAARVHASARHQDGRTVLALRAMLQAAREADPRLAGAILVGAFPEAFLVRSCNWRKKTPIVIREGRPDEKRFAEPVPYLRTVAEDVAHTADIVLSDLDGRWDALYVERRERLPTHVGVFPDGVPARGGVTADFERGHVAYEDYFHVDDGKLEVGEVLGADGEVVALRLRPLDAGANEECGPRDLARSNPMARPDIAVSRIDARGVALRPRRDVVGARGERLLDAQGRPQTVTFAEGAPIPHWRDALWEPDPALERRLLIDYFERNHRWRRGDFRDPETFRPASLAHDLGSGFGVVRRAAPAWSDFAIAGYDVAGRPSLEALVGWLGRPAALRTVRAHSDPWGSVFGRPDVAALDRAAGPAWSWTPRGRALVPSLQAACAGGKADFFLLRTLWENRRLADDAALYLHTGCHGISPPGAARLPWSDPRHGARAGGASLLFYGNGLALIGRAKVFYDEPRGFAAALRNGQTFGEAWRRYFELESLAGSWDEVGGDIGRKRAYFWSVIGDWTLRLLPREPH